jgi:hypothetical protein
VPPDFTLSTFNKKSLLRHILLYCARCLSLCSLLLLVLLLCVCGVCVRCERVCLSLKLCTRICHRPHQKYITQPADSIFLPAEGSLSWRVCARSAHVCVSTVVSMSVHQRSHFLYRRQNWKTKISLSIDSNSIWHQA